MSSPLVDSSMNSLFAIPASTWTAVDTFIGDVMQQENINPAVTQSFWLLYNSANDWIGSAFPAMQWQGARIADCASYAQFQFSAINTKFKALKPHAPVPAALQTQAQTAIRVTAYMAARLQDSAEETVRQINTLAANAAQVGGELKADGEYFEDLTPAFAGLGDAVTKVGLAGSGLAKDLGAIAANEITFEFLMSLDIPYALNAWADLAAESAAFTASMQEQKKYLSPPWHSPGPMGARWNRQTAQDEKTVATQSIGPAPLTQPGIPGGLPFILWRIEWL
jgi:hypothetical protein